MRFTPTYEAPTYRQYDRSADQWHEWKLQAHAIASDPKQGIKEVRRHASVSTDNGHACVECFCCACVTYLEEVGQ